MNKDNIFDSISTLKGVGPQLSNYLKNRNINLHSENCRLIGDRLIERLIDVNSIVIIDTIMKNDDALKDTVALKKTLEHFDIINKDLLSIFRLKGINFEKDERIQWNLFMNQFLNYSILHGRSIEDYLPSWIQ